MTRREAQRKVDEIYCEISGIVCFLKARERTLDDNRATVLATLERILQVVSLGSEYKEGISLLDDNGYRAYAEELSRLLFKMKYGSTGRTPFVDFLQLDRNLPYSRQPMFTAATYPINNPIRYVDPDVRIIDFQFVIQLEGGQHLNGYVPQNSPGTAIDNSGVTIASGFDLGQHNQDDLYRIFGRGTENADLRTLYSPYLLLRRDRAIEFLNNNPLTITRAQANRTDIAVMN